MKDYRNTFVSADDGTLPRLAPLAKLPPPQPTPDIDAGALYGRSHSTHTRDPLSEAYAFLVKYSALSVILLVLAIGLTLRMEWNIAAGIVTFAGLATTAYWLLALSENRYSAPGIERHRLTLGTRVLLAQVDAERAVRMAQVNLQRAQLDAQREANAYTIDAARTRARAQLPQATARPQLATPVSFNVEDLQRPTWATETPQDVPHTDPARQALLDAVVMLYERDDSGEWANMDGYGYIHNNTLLPWSKRGGHAQTTRRGMLDLLHRSRLAGFDDARRQWRVSVKLFPDADSAIDAIGNVATVEVG